MSADILDTDPTTEWVTKHENAAEMQAIHASERMSRGFSRYDWYNFDKFLSFLFAQVSRNILTGDQSLQPDADEMRVKAVALNFVQEYLYYHTKDDEGMDFSSSTSIRAFLQNVFPYLPASPDRYYTAISFPSSARFSEGFSRHDMDNMRSYLTSIMVDGLNMFAGPLAHGYRGESPQAWANEINKIIYYLGTLQAHSENFLNGSYPDWFTEEDTLRFETGKRLLAQHFGEFWD